MESVSLFPKIHLELCDMQCKDDDLVIESSVTLKVSFPFQVTLHYCQRKINFFHIFRLNTFLSDVIVIRLIVCVVTWLIYYRKILTGPKI